MARVSGEGRSDSDMLKGSGCRAEKQGQGCWANSFRIKAQVTDSGCVEGDNKQVWYKYIMLQGKRVWQVQTVDYNIYSYYSNPQLS